MSAVCEEFHCLPSQAVRELETDPSRLALTIMALRSYRRTLDALDRQLAGQKGVSLPVGLMTRWAKRHTERLIDEEATAAAVRRAKGGR